MNRKSSLVALVALLAVLLAGGTISAFHGFGGGGGGSHGDGGSVERVREEPGGDYGRSFREEEGERESSGRTPSFSAARSHEDNGSGMNGGRRGSVERTPEGRINEDERPGSDTQARVKTINYGAAGVGARVAVVHAARRGVSGVVGTAAGSRSHAAVGRTGRAVGPGGEAGAGRSNPGVGSGQGPGAGRAGGLEGPRSHELPDRRRRPRGSGTVVREMRRLHRD